jgi:hypothetical protein
MDPEQTDNSLRYADAVAASLDEEKLHDALDEAVIVIDERELERSRNDPRVQNLFAQGRALAAELEAEGAVVGARSTPAHR